MAGLGRNADQIARGLLPRQSVDGCDRLLAVVAEDDQCGVGLGQAADRPEGALESGIEVECRAELTERRNLLPLLARIAQGASHLGEQALRAPARRLDARDLERRRFPPARKEHDSKGEQERRERQGAHAGPRSPAVE